MGLFDNFFKRDEEVTKKKIDDHIAQFAQPDNEGGAIQQDVDKRMYEYNQTNFNISQTMFGGQQRVTNVAKLIDSYRDVALMPEVDNAIDEICKQAIVINGKDDPVKLNLDDIELSDNIKEKINKEFVEILSLLNFNQKGYKLFRKWYVDSRIYFHKIMHKSENKGLAELRLLNPKKMQYHRDVIKEHREGVDVVVGYEDYFIHDDTLDANCPSCQIQFTQPLKIPAQAIVYAHQGLTDNCDQVIGYLHRAIKLSNMLNQLQDAMAIYRIARAPERRVFYIDVQGLPTAKAQEQLNRIMQSVKNRVVYDSAQGKISTQYNNMSMTEDFYLTRRDGNAKTEISTLPGAQQLGETGDIEWINQKLYESLRVPLSRIPSRDNTTMFSNGQEIARDELSFAKFVNSLQNEFSKIFLEPLETQLVCKRILTLEEFEDIKNKIKFIFQKDSFFEEIKQLEVMDRKLQTAQALDPYLGKLFSYDYLYKHVFNMTDQEIDEQREIIAKEKKEGLYKDPTEDDFDDNDANQQEDESQENETLNK